MIQPINTHPLLQIDDLSVTYNPDEWNEHCVLNNISLTIEPGQLFVLTGGNGSGKSTLLKLLSNELLQVRSEGKVLLNGKNLQNKTELELSTHLSIIDQDPNKGTCEHLLVREQLQLAGETVANNILQKLKELGSNIQQNQRIQDLSGGQRQLITALIALQRKPLLLLADEPTAALDKHFSEIILNFIVQRTLQQNMSSIIVTHHDLLPDHEKIKKIKICDSQLMIE